MGQIICQKLQKEIKENGETNAKVELQDLKMDLWNTKMELTKLRKENEKFRLEVWTQLDILIIINYSRNDLMKQLSQT